MRRSLLFGLTCLLALSMLSLLALPGARGSQDVGRYGEIARSAGDVLRGQTAEFKSEYPPLASALFTFVRMEAGGGSFADAWIAVILLAIAAATVLCTRSARDPDSIATIPLAVLLTVLLLGSDVVFARFDILIGLLLLLTWWEHRRGAFRGSGFFLFLAVSLKLTPLLLAPILFVQTPREGRRGLLEGALLGAALGIAIPLALLGTSLTAQNAAYIVGYHGVRGIQAESLWSSVDLLIRTFTGEPIVMNYHQLSMENRDLPASLVRIVAGILLAGLAVMTIWAARRHRHPAETGLFLCTTLFWILAMSPILSPQYFVWVLPLFGAWVLEETRRLPSIPRALLPMIMTVVAIAVTTQWIFPMHYDDLVDRHQRFPILILFARNLLVLAAAALGVRLLSRHETARSGLRASP